MTAKIIGICILFFTGQVFESVFSKTKIPSSLIIILFGYLAAQVLNLIDPNTIFKLVPIVAQSLLFAAIVQCAFLLKAKELLKFSVISTALATANLALITLSVSLIAHFALKFPFDQSLFLGIVLGGTSLFVAPYFLTSSENNNKFNSIMVYESIFAISLTSLLGLFLIDILQLEKISAGPLLLGIFPNILKSGSIGIAAGLLWTFIKKKLNKFTPSVFSTEIWCILVYVYIEHINLNGLIGILAFGFIVSNLELTPPWIRKHLKLDLNQTNSFPLIKSALIVLKTFMFFFIGASLNFKDKNVVLLATLIVILIFLFRYLSVRLFLKPHFYSAKEAMTLTSFGMRGFVAASLAVLPFTSGVINSVWIYEVVFLVIPSSILLSIIFKLVSETNFATGSSFLFIKYAVPQSIDSFEADKTDAFIHISPNGEYLEPIPNTTEISPSDSEVIYESFEKTDPLIISDELLAEELTTELNLNEVAEVTQEIEIDDSSEMTTEINLDEEPEKNEDDVTNPTFKIKKD